MMALRTSKAVRSAFLLFFSWRVFSTPMYALSFDMDISEVKAHYGEPYNGAYYDIIRD